MDHGNEFRGSKYGGKELWVDRKWPEMAEKNQEQSGDHGGRRRRFAGPIPARPTAVGLENLPTGSSGCPLPPCPARVAGGRPVVPLLLQTPTAHKWFKNGLTRCSRFWRVFPRVLGAQDGVLGARVSFGNQSYVYIRPRVAFR